MRRNNRGTILVASLWILAILAVLAVGIGFRVSIEARLSKYGMDRLKALYLAKAGLLRTLELMSKDSNNYESVAECGIAFDENQKKDIAASLKGIFNAEVDDGSYIVGYEDGGTFHYGITDESRKININKADEVILANLIKECCANTTSAEDAAISILYWRSPASATVSTADEGYYGTIEHPYKCKHAEFTVLEELLLVKGVTPQLFDSIKDYLTVHGDGRININTAPPQVLAATGMSELIMNDVISYRVGSDKLAGTEDDRIYAVVPDLGHPNITNLFTTRSDYFRIESKGLVTKSNISKTIICVAGKPGAGGKTTLRSYREL